MIRFLRMGKQVSATRLGEVQSKTDEKIRNSEYMHLPLTDVDI